MFSEDSTGVTIISSPPATLEEDRTWKEGGSTISKLPVTLESDGTWKQGGSTISKHPVTLENYGTCKQHQARGDFEGEVTTLIPGLPDDVVLRIMLKLPRSNWCKLRLVSRAWRKTLEDPRFYQSRVAQGLTEEWCYTEAWHPETKLVSWFAFDSSHGTWTALPRIPRKKGWDPEIFGRAATSLRGELYVVGGKAGVSGPTLQEMFIYSPFTHRWRIGKSMVTGRHSPLMFSTLEQKLYVLGGFDYLNNGIASGECYDADTEEWTIAGNVNCPDLLCPSWYHVGWQVQWAGFHFGNVQSVSYKTKASQQVGKYYVPEEGAWITRDHGEKAKALLRYSVGAIVSRNVVLLDWGCGRLRYNFYPSRDPRDNVGWASVRGMADLDWVTILRNNPKASALGSKFVLVGRGLSIRLIETDPALLEDKNRKLIESFLAQSDSPDLEALGCVTVVA